MKDVWNYNATAIHPLGAFVLIICALMILTVNKNWVFLPVLIVMSFVSNAQRINLAGLDFTFARILVIVSWTRIFFRHEYDGYKFQRADLILLMWIFARGFVYSLQWGNRDAIINQLGDAFTTCGFYFMARVYLSDINEIKQFGRQLAIVALPTSVFFAIEWLTGKNYFSIFGGVEFITWVRDGRLRCGGAYSHPLIAGYFWGVAIPFIATLYDKDSQHKKIAVTGLMCSLMIVVSTASSTPVLGVLAWGMGWGLYLIRKILLYLVLGLLVTTFVLHIYMRAPVWHLISRIGVVGGSTGYHRFHLIDAFIRNVGEWFFLGVKSTTHWGEGLHDITNEFILQGVRGGIVGLILFTLLVVMVMFLLWLRTLKAKDDFSQRYVTWNMWTAIFMQVIIFFSLSHFGQASIMFYISLGAGVSLAYFPLTEAKDDSVQKEIPREKKKNTEGWIVADRDSNASGGGWIQ